MSERTLSNLERELAILRGIKLQEAIAALETKSLFAIISTAQKMESPEEAHSARKTYTTGQAAQNLQNLMLSIHAILFQDSYRFEGEGLMTSPHKPGVVYPSESSPVLQKLMNSLAKELFRYGSKPVPERQLPAIFAKYYAEFARLEPFAYGNHETFSMFFTSLVELANIRDLYLDFRRLSPEQEEILQLSNTRSLGENTQAQLQEIFSTALDSRISRNKPYVKETWRELEDLSIELGSRRFLKVVRDDKTYLVTVNGGLVSLDEHMPGNGTLRHKIDESVKAGTPLNDIKITPDQIQDYVGNLREKTHIDGISLEKGANLICMDVNPITGLTDRYNSRVRRLLAREKVTNIFDLAKPEVADRIRETLVDHSHFRRILDITIENATAMEKVIKAAVDKAFEDKTSVGVGNNHAVETVGGAGSGKGTVGKETIRAVAGNNYVTASIDDARGEFDIYKLMTELGHHSDDYMAVSEAAGEIRKRIAKRAIEEGFNLLYDGSGIPWDGYSKLAAEWRGKVAKVHVAAADCELYVQEDRRNEHRETGIDRTFLRKEIEKRILPLEEIISRHIAAPGAYLEAFKDPNVDEFTLSDRAGEFADAYTIAKKYIVSKDILTELNEARKGDGLLETLRKHNLIPERAKAEQMLDSNVDFIAHKGQNGTYSILTINNASRFIDILRKGSMKKDAVGPDELACASDSMRWVTLVRSKVQNIEHSMRRDFSATANARF